MFSITANSINTPRISVKAKVILSMAIVLMLANTTMPTAHADTIKTFPILDRLQKQGSPLAKETQKWMKRWRGVNLDDPGFSYEGLSGTTSLNMKVRKVDATSQDGYKSYGSYVTRNDSAHFDAEIAYFNLAAILGYDTIFRPTVRYSLGPKAMQAFKSLLISMPLDNQSDIRLNNRTLILKEIAKGKPLRGCLKAKNIDSNINYDIIANLKTRKPNIKNPIIMALQAQNPQPVAGKPLQLLKGYTGDSLALAREFSIIMTLDGIFEQWDRYSGGNVVLARDTKGVAHFNSTDNGGTEISKEPYLATQSLSYFSRYDRKTIAQLKTLYAFLKRPSKGYLGYKNAQAFIVDLGLYSEFTPTVYTQLITRNLEILFTRVANVERQYGSKKTYLP